MASDVNGICHSPGSEALANALRERAVAEPAGFAFGIEEEYFLVDSTGNLAFITPDSLFESAKSATEGQVDREFLQSQVEIAIPPQLKMSDARTELSYLRRVVSQYAKAHGLRIIACGTHPTANWEQSVQSRKQRYDKVMDDLQIIGRRNLLCGMHVHVSVPDPALRVELMRRITPFVPLFIALSTSSPFWQSHVTGLRGYRLAAYDELPRTGIPEYFSSTHEYEAYVQALVNAGAIESSSSLWWTLRPSAKYPTLELRAPDCCTRIDDAIAIAALYRSLVRHFVLRPNLGRPPDTVSRALAVENKWRAQRYGIHGTFATEDGPIPVRDFLDRTLAMIEEDIGALQCADEIERCRTIAAEGTSADSQVAIYDRNRQTPEASDPFAAVIDWIAQTTVSV
ncbi:carboxylate-amine ligase [Hyphomicrobium sp.]|uniref:carboxylate-amine ligase n=1 Tax=Hyphomicrobium sp. TaxID=82 RepID=UPI002D782E93|nr:carboxylate-amine ligase [Hyphomicrobium sp.]HET6387982.1 carboxylate-amine ligase [Hyphomicrobium sp.]